MLVSTCEKPKCKLVGTDGNVFALLGKVSSTLRKAGMKDKADEMMKRVPECHSYDDALQLIMDYVEVV